MNRAPKLLVEWSSPWSEFVTSIRPALMKSPPRLAGEARTGGLPYRRMAVTWTVEAFLLVLLIIVPFRTTTLNPYQLRVTSKYDVIYYSGDELPQTEDRGGAEKGKAGTAGGKTAAHRTQVIRVARGNVLREKVVDAPSLNLPQSITAVQNFLAYKSVPGPPPVEGMRSAATAPSPVDVVIAPSPDVRRDNMLVAPLLDKAVPPSPGVRREQLRNSPSMNALVVPPSPSGIQRDVTSVQVPGSQLSPVVPPPVSAPEQATKFNSQLTLPAPRVVAPPPTDVTREVAPRGPGFGPGQPQKQVVPPPVQVGNASARRDPFTGLGGQDVAPPPVAWNGATTQHSQVPALGNANVVPPPVQTSGIRSGPSGPPIPGTAKVVPPAVQVGGGSLPRGRQELGGGTAVVPPPPTVTADSSPLGQGRGSRGSGFGGPLDAGSVTAPPSHPGGTDKGSGIVLSKEPGSTVGKPASAGAGALTLSPQGGTKPGLGGPGTGTDIARGAGSGAAMKGGGTGATESGSGTGGDLTAHNSISPYPGEGGAGTGAVSKPPMPGVSVHGGNTVTLPSFGAGGNDPSLPSRSPKMKPGDGPDITVVGSPRSGGAFGLYDALKGDKVYSIYIDTTLGMAVMEYSDPTSANHPYADDLVPPQPLRANLPAHLKLSRLVISCVLDSSGSLKNTQVREQTGSSEITRQILAALSSWKFHPAYRGDQPVPVTAYLGFDIDTR
ncbi:MAG TPA: energy transducer TonB [Terriglobales bacterium]|nr:energy transducer TonB [Terriglobales bacterium]